MKNAEQVLVRPVVSEKSYALMEDGAYIFVVSPDATKIDVRHAVEQAFGVRVLNVNERSHAAGLLRFGHYL